MKSLKKLLVAGLLATSFPAAAQSIWGPGVASAFTTGSILFASGGVVAQNNAKLFWDNTNFRLGLGTATPATTLDVAGAAQVSGNAAFNGTVSGTGLSTYLASPPAIGGTAAAAVKATTLTGTSTFNVTGTGPHAIGGATNADSQLLQTGAFTGSTNAYASQISSTLTVPANGSGAALTIAPTINKAGSGTHADFASVLLPAPTIGAGAATLTNASTLKISGAPSVGTNKRALWVAAGDTVISGKLVNEIDGINTVVSEEGLIYSSTGTALYRRWTIADTGMAGTIAVDSGVGYDAGYSTMIHVKVYEVGNAGIYNISEGIALSQGATASHSISLAMTSLRSATLGLGTLAWSAATGAADLTYTANASGDTSFVEVTVTSRKGNAISPP